MTDNELQTAIDEHLRRVSAGLVGLHLTAVARQLPFIGRTMSKNFQRPIVVGCVFGEVEAVLYGYAIPREALEAGRSSEH